MSGKKSFQVVGEQDMPEETTQRNDQAKIGMQMLLLGLQALSQRAMTAITNLMTVGLVASAWVLWHSILPNPTGTQLAAVGGYALFVLMIDIVRRKN